MDMHSQKYNPEVPTLQTNSNERLHQINDQLITLKNMVNRQVRRRNWVCTFRGGFCRIWPSSFDIEALAKWGQLILIFISRIHLAQEPELRLTNLFSILHIQMTYSMTNDNDKMLRDMAEGSADYENPYEEYDDEDDMSGSGDNNNCKFRLIGSLMTCLINTWFHRFLFRWSRSASYWARTFRRCSKQPST